MAGRASRLPDIGCPSGRSVPAIRRRRISRPSISGRGETRLVQDRVGSRTENRVLLAEPRNDKRENRVSIGKRDRERRNPCSRRLSLGRKVPAPPSRWCVRDQGDGAAVRNPTVHRELAHTVTLRKQQFEWLEDEAEQRSQLVLYRL